MADMGAGTQDEGAGTALEALRSGRALVQKETWEHEPELMVLLGEALSLYWDCFDRLSEHEMRDDVEKTLVYLGAAGFQTLQSCFTLIEFGHYRQAAVLIRLMMNEYLLCNRFRLDPESARSFLSGSDWSTVQLQGADLLPLLGELDGYPRQLAEHLSTALREGYSWTAYVASQQLLNCPQVSRKAKDALKALLTELAKDRLPGMSALLQELGRIGLSRDKVLEHRFDLELLHRHAHACGVTVKAEVVARDSHGGQWITPRYERSRCRYCGYRLGLWSTLVLALLADHFELLRTDHAWTERLVGFSEGLRSWAGAAEMERRAAIS
jgi:hypothetical protein